MTTDNITGKPEPVPPRNSEAAARKLIMELHPTAYDMDLWRNKTVAQLVMDLRTEHEQLLREARTSAFEEAAKIVDENCSEVDQYIVSLLRAQAARKETP